MSKSDLEKVQMSIFRPGRRSYYIARWVDPDTGRRRQRSLRVKKRNQAWDEASELVRKLLVGVSPDDPGWLDFCRLYEDGHINRKSAGHQENWRTVKWSVDAFGVPSLSHITAAWVVKWQAKLRTDKLAANTVASYSTRLRAALNWARKHDLLLRVPYIAVETEEAPRSRAITGEEFDRIIGAVKEIRPDDADQWKRLLRGLSQVNLRIGELIRLSWDEDQPIHIDNRGRYPLIRMAARAQKSRKVRIQPITPEFWKICCENRSRTGLVFPLVNLYGEPMTLKRIIRTIAEIGHEARVVTNPETGKNATSHDIGRRAFLGKVDGKLTATEVHKWMGHSSFDTTLTFYDTRSAEDLAEKLWAAGGASGGAKKRRSKKPNDAK